MNYEQLLESIQAQKDKPLFNKEELRKVSGDVVRGLSATALMMIALPNIATGIDALYDASQSREIAHTQEQSGNPEKAESANKDAEQYEMTRNISLGSAGVQLFAAAANISVIALNTHKRRTKEVIISGEKPTEQPIE